MEASKFLALAVAEASRFEGATSPNPPVGACIVKNGRVLAVGAHQMAGTDHAEVVAIKAAIANHGPESLVGAQIYVTLEPCNHYGQTPPCTKAILEAGIQEVIYAENDPNPKATDGALFLKTSGIQVRKSPFAPAAKQLAPFLSTVTRKRPFITLKQAFRLTNDGQLTMIPEAGSKKTTFSSPGSLKIAHELRKKSDAIITGMGTILADWPQFTVRHIPDHAEKHRFLCVIGDLDRLKKSPELSLKFEQWCQRQSSLGFRLEIFRDIMASIDFISQEKVLHVLVEAGPKLSEIILKQHLWDERLVILAQASHGQDFIYTEAP